MKHQEELILSSLDHCFPAEVFLSNYQAKYNVWRAFYTPPSVMTLLIPWASHDDHLMLTCLATWAKTCTDGPLLIRSIATSLKQSLLSKGPPSSCHPCRNNPSSMIRALKRNSLHTPKANPVQLDVVLSKLFEGSLLFQWSLSPSFRHRIWCALRITLSQKHIHLSWNDQSALESISSLLQNHYKVSWFSMYKNKIRQIAYFFLVFTSNDQKFTVDNFKYPLPLFTCFTNTNHVSSLPVWDAIELMSMYSEQVFKTSAS